MKEAKGHHYVPRTYLKAFSNPRKEQYYIKALAKEHIIGGNIAEINITKICVENDYYTLPLDTPEGRMFIENFYSTTLEERYQRIYKILIDEDITTISEDVRQLIIATMVTMLFRTVKLNNSLNKFMGEVYAVAYNSAKKAGKDYFIVEGEKVLIKDKTLAELIKENSKATRPAIVLNQLQLALKCINLRQSSDTIHITKLDDSRAEFITSDNPVICKNSGVRFIAPFDPTNILELPLDGKHKLSLFPVSDNSKTKHSIFRNKERGTKVISQKVASDSYQYKSAERFLLGSITALEDFQSIIKVSSQRTAQ